MPLTSRHLPRDMAEADSGGMVADVERDR